MDIRTLNTVGSNSLCSMDSNVQLWEKTECVPSGDILNKMGNSKGRINHVIFELQNVLLSNFSCQVISAES